MSTRLLLNIARPWGEGDPSALATAAVEAGANGVGFADSPRLFPDPWLEAERVLTRHPHALAGPCVLGLGLHDPSVVAQSLLTLARHHPGRAFSVVGRGESSVRNEGRPIPSLASYSRALDRLGERLGRQDEDRLVLGAASGPRTIAATAARLPGVLIDAGIEPRVIGKAVAAARAESENVQVWLFLRAVVVTTPSEWAAAAAPILGSCAARLTAAPDWYEVPPEHRDAIASTAARYDYRRHGIANQGEVFDNKLASLIAERFVLAGNALTVAHSVRAIGSLAVDGIVVAGATAGLAQNLGATLTALRSGLSAAAPDRPNAQNGAGA